MKTDLYFKEVFNMKEMFGKGFGFIAGIYAAFVAIAVVDSMLPDNLQQYKKPEETKSETKEEEAN